MRRGEGEKRGVGEKYGFVQAEDGIRDLVRSRGLGDVYKRQVDEKVGVIADSQQVESLAGIMGGDATAVSDDTQPVSYTHLTLPTIYSV